MKIKPIVYFLIGVLIFALVFLVTSLTYESLKVKLMPAIVSGITLILTAIVLVRELGLGRKISSEKVPGAETKEHKDSAPLSAFMRAFAWFLALILGVCLFGFLVSIPIWVFIYLWKQGHKWWISVIHAIVVVSVIYVAFVAIMNIELYSGILFGLLDS
jgi:hypothetical protein